MSSDGSSNVFGAIVLIGIICAVVVVGGGLAMWFHARSEKQHSISEAQKDAECNKLGGVRVQLNDKDQCIRKDVFIQVPAKS